MAAVRWKAEAETEETIAAGRTTTEETTAAGRIMTEETTVAGRTMTEETIVAGKTTTEETMTAAVAKKIAGTDRRILLSGKERISGLPT